MFPLIASRLQLLPMTQEQLSLFSSDPPALASNLDLRPAPLRVPPDFQKELEEAIDMFCRPMVRQHPDQYVWYTHWLIIHLANECIIGGLGLSGPPNPKGEVMIGYYIDQHYEGRGYATEATACLCQWLEKQDGVRKIMATTPVGHIASERVLQKNGFVFEQRIQEEGMEVSRWVKIVLS